MAKRSSSAIGLLAVLAAGSYTAYELSRLYQYRTAFAGSYTYHLMFSSAGWLLPLSIFVGIFMGAAIKHQEPQVSNGKVLRHDQAAFLVHWAHALSTLLLVATGIYLGFLFIPRLLAEPQDIGFALNLHFVGVVIFLFSISFHLTDLYLSGKLTEHMPQSGDLKDAITHYTSKIGIGNKPREGKYLASERLSYPLWIISVGLLVLTGLVKSSAHIWNLSGSLMGSVTMLHDIGALLLTATLAIHVLMSSIMPWSWQLLRSMITGYASVEYVKKNHVLWYEELTGEHIPEEPPKKGKKTSVPS